MSTDTTTPCTLSNTRVGELDGHWAVIVDFDCGWRGWKWVYNPDCSACVRERAQCDGGYETMEEGIVTITGRHETWCRKVVDRSPD